MRSRTRPADAVHRQPPDVPGLWGRNVGALGWLRTLAAAFVPFGTFANDVWLARVGASPQHEP